MSTKGHSNRMDDLLFVAGALTGMLVLSVGIVFLILGLSVGVREIEFFDTGLSRTLAILGGLLLCAAGIGLRAVRDRVEAESTRRALRHGGSATVLVGLVAFMLGFSAEQTTSAPFLTSMNQKVILILASLAFIAAGSLIVRLAGRRIGW